MMMMTMAKLYKFILWIPATLFVQSGKLVLTRSKPFCHTQSDDDDEDDYGDDDDVDDADFDHVGHGQTPMLFCLLQKV